MDVTPIILAGGAGTRLWPLSRKSLPKQFLKIQNTINLLQNTLLNVADRNVFAAPIIICNSEYRWKVEDSLHEINIKGYQLIIEPISKNTAAAITAASIILEGKDTAMLVMPVDQCIYDNKVFTNDVRSCLKLDVSEEYLIAFGQKHTYSSTLYGCMKKGIKLGGSELYKIDSFIEKPRHEVTKVLDVKNHICNTGIFLFRADRYLKEVNEIQPALFMDVKKSIEHMKKEKNVFMLELSHYNKCKDISVEYAIMEQTKRGAVYIGDFDWSDIGNFSSIYQTKDKDAAGNATEGDTLLLDSKDCYIHSNKGLFTVGIGLNGITVAATKDAVLVSSNKDVEKIKKVIQNLECTSDKQELLYGNIEYRPWGYYENLVIAVGYKIKRIVVKESSKLSLQSHKFRSEQWTVIKGRARVTVQEKVFDLDQGQSTYIPIEAKHRLENCTDKPLEIIEIQIGECLEESDIKRFEDIYGRNLI